MFTACQLHANHCVMLWQHEGEEETGAALKELQSTGKQKETTTTMSMSTGRGAKITTQAVTSDSAP